MAHTSAQEKAKRQTFSQISLCVISIQMIMYSIYSDGLSLDCHDMSMQNISKVLKAYIVLCIALLMYTHKIVGHAVFQKLMLARRQHFLALNKI